MGRGVFDPGERLYGDEQSGPRQKWPIRWNEDPSARNRRDCSPLTARSYACNQVAALMSGSHLKPTLVLVPVSRAAP